MNPLIVRMCSFVLTGLDLLYLLYGGKLRAFKLLGVYESCTTLGEIHQPCQESYYVAPSQHLPENLVIPTETKRSLLTLYIDSETHP